MKSTLSGLIAEWLEDATFPGVVAGSQMMRPPDEKLEAILALVGPRRAGKTYYFFSTDRANVSVWHCIQRRNTFIQFSRIIVCLALRQIIFRISFKIGLAPVNRFAVS